MLVESVVVYINGITKAHNNLHVVQSPQRIVNGLPLHMPKVDFGQFGLGHIGAENNLTDPENERSFNCLYVRRADNGSGDIVFALDTLQQRSVNRFTAIPISSDTIKRVNKLGKDDKQPKGIIFGDFYGKVTIHDFDDNAGDSDGNASDEDFEHDQSYEEEFEEESAKENIWLTQARMRSLRINVSMASIMREACQKKSIQYNMHTYTHVHTHFLYFISHTFIKIFREAISLIFKLLQCCTLQRLRAPQNVIVDRFSIPPHGHLVHDSRAIIAIVAAWIRRS